MEERLAEVVYLPRKLVNRLRRHATAQQCDVGRIIEYLVEMNDSRIQEKRKAFKARQAAKREAEPTQLTDDDDITDLMD